MNVVPDGFLLCRQLLEVGVVDAACLVDAAGELVQVVAPPAQERDQLPRGSTPQCARSWRQTRQLGEYRLSFESR